MNELGLVLLGCGLRVTVLAAVGILVTEAARRRSPAAGALVSLASLTSLIALSVLAFSPWPRWWTLERLEVRSAAHPTADRGGEVAATPRTGPGQEPEAQDEAREPADPRPGFSWIERVGEVAGAAWDAVRQAPAVERSPRWGWPAWLAVALMVGSALGLVRLGAGLAAVRGCRARARPIACPGLRDLVDILRAEMGCLPPVELRESAEVTTPATVGWRRPVLLLPVGWRSWSEDELRAVVAHELAHICREDYPASVAAQLSVALHFYHPLAHWLASRLRLLQELAADAWGARLSGGNQPYLMALAQMALRTDDRPIGWPARAFLPARGTFLRRIQMLRDAKNTIRHTPLPRVARAVTVGGLAAAALMLAGLRGPLGPAPAAAQEGGAADRAPDRGAKAPFDLTYVAPDADVLIALRPAAILGRRGMEPLADALRQRGGPGQPELPIDRIEQAVFAFEADLGPRPGGPVRPMLTSGFVRFLGSKDRQPFIDAIVPKGGPGEEEIRYAGKAYHKLPQAGPAPEFSYFFPDDRTIAFGSERNVRRLIAREKANPPDFPWTEPWRKVETGMLAIAVDTGAVRDFVGQLTRGNPRTTAPLATFAPLWDETKYLVLGVNVSEKLALEGTAACVNDAGGERVAQTLQAVVTLSRNALDGLRQHLAGAPPQTREPAERLIRDLAEPILKSARVDRDGSTVRLTASTDRSPDELVKILTPSIEASRQAARRVQSTNNLKQIGLAMHNYAQVNNGKFPAAANLGPDGKHVHSWRVAILPYLEQQALYDQYRFDEPWDGPNNRKLIDKMPSVFRAPNAKGKPNTPSYFALTGPSTIFSGREGTQLMDIRDGTSNTILIVEAEQNIPWTKPADIPYSPDQPLPELGGFSPGGFNVLFADGSVRFVVSNIDERVLRAMITKDGGEVLQMNGPNPAVQGGRPTAPARRAAPTPTPAPPGAGRR